MSKQPYKVCPNCGQPAVLSMPRCGRCGRPYPKPFRWPGWIGLAILATVIVFVAEWPRVTAMPIHPSLAPPQRAARITWFMQGSSIAWCRVQNVGTLPLVHLTLHASVPTMIEQGGFGMGFGSKWVPTGFQGRGPDRVIMPGKLDVLYVMAVHPYDDFYVTADDGAGRQIEIDFDEETKPIGAPREL